MMSPVTGTSMAATAACPSITGVVTTNSAASVAVAPPYQRRAHSHVASTRTRRNGSMPSRASVSTVS